MVLNQPTNKIPFIDCIDKEVHPYVFPDTPAVISVGMRCIQDGWDFVWRKFSRPYFRKKDGAKIKLEVKDYVPYLPSKDGRTPASVGVPFSWTSAAGNGKPSLVPRRTTRMSAVGFESDEEEPYEASIASRTPKTLSVLAKTSGSSTQVNLHPVLQRL